MDVYVYLNGEKRGPFSSGSVERMLADGILRPTDLAAEKLDGDWKPLSNLNDRPHLDPLRAGEKERHAQPHPSTGLGPVGEGPPAGRRGPDASTPPPPLAAVQQSLGSYARATIGPNEEVIYKTSVHWILFVRYAVLTVLVFFFVGLPLAIGVQALLASRIGWILLPFTLLILLPPMLTFMTSELVVTNRRVLIKTGAVSRQTLEMFISKVESVGVDQSFLGRMLDFGTVIIRGTGGSEEPFATIAQPIRFRNAVQRVQTDGAAVAA